MSLLLASPILLPLAAAAGCALAFRSLAAQRWISLGAGLLQFAASALLLDAVRRDGVLAVQVGSWAAPFGITLVADLLAGIMVLAGALMGVCVNFYAVGSLDRKYESSGFHPLYQVLMAGVSGAFLTGDIFNLYVQFEVLLVASFALAALGSDRSRIGGAVQYAALNLLGSFLFLVAVGLLYRTAGTLNMAALAREMGEGAVPGPVRSIAMLLLAAFGIKAAVFPFYWWLPESYPKPPAAVSAIFAGLLTKVGVYAFFRVFTLVFPPGTGIPGGLFLAIAGLTMLTGVLGAAARKEFREILSFHIISQIGYMIMGLGLYSLAGAAGGIFYIFHHIVVKTNLFLISGLVRRLEGSYRLERLGAMLERSPFTALLFLVPALSLAGMPPLSGFAAKLFLVKAGLDGGRYAIAAIALATGLLTLFSMTKIWNEVFLKPCAGQDAGAGDGSTEPWRAACLWGPPSVLAAVTVFLGLGAGLAYPIARAAADQLLDRSAYLRAVLGGS